VKPLTPEQQDAVNRLHHLLGDKRPDEREVRRVWQKLDESTTNPFQRMILQNLHTALRNLRSDEVSDLQAILGSWGDTMNDEETLGFLRALKINGRILIPFE
jgi:hypothetical protein